MIYPFQKGLWTVFVPFLSAPAWLHNALVTPGGAFLFLTLPIAFSAVAVWWAKRTSEPKVTSSIGLLSFLAIGLAALWDIGDMFINYYTYDVGSGIWSNR